MWFPSGPVWSVGLSARRLVRAQRTGRWSGARLVCDRLPCEPQDGEEPWRAVVRTLCGLLARERVRGTVVRVVLSGQFVRWKLIPWQAALRRQDEVEGYARACFGETYGAAAGHWAFLYAMQPPGKPMPACAIDAGLQAALRDACADAGARLELVTPYFASVADHWRGSLRRGTAWLGLIEDDCVSLGLLRAGGWLALHTRRVHGDGMDHLPAMMAQLGVAADLTDAGLALYLAGDGAAPAARAGLPFVWLDPALPVAQGDVACRMALGR